MKNIFQGSTLLLIVLFLIMLVAKTDFDNLAVLQSNSLAAVPMSWNLDQVRNNITRYEQRYDRYYFEKGLDPNSNFMRRQEAAMAAMRQRQYDLEFEQSMGTYAPDVYNPEDYKLKNFISDGNPTPRVSYDPNAKSGGNPLNNLPSGLQGLTSLTGASPSTDQSDLPWASQTHHQGVPFGGQVTSMLWCDCETSASGESPYISYINDYVSKSGIWLKVDDSSKIYDYYHVIPNRYVVGTYDPVATCSMTINQCNPVPVNGKINRGPGAGTSL